VGCEAASKLKTERQLIEITLHHFLLWGFPKTYSNFDLVTAKSRNRNNYLLKRASWEERQTWATTPQRLNAPPLFFLPSDTPTGYFDKEHENEQEGARELHTL
jgi:hypothetical protein